jgi:hypothetical protein
MAVGTELVAVFKPGENVSVQASGAAIAAGHFVSLKGKNAKGSYNGAHTGAGLLAFGVAERDAIADVTDWRGQTNCTRRGSIARVVAGAAIDASAAAIPVKSDATGRAIPQAGSGIILGYAVSTVTLAGQIVEVDLV